MSAAPPPNRHAAQDIVLDVRDLQTHFFTSDGVVRAVNGVSLQVRRGRALGLVGESGSGKSVTGFSIMGLVDAPGRVVGGQVLFEGQDLLRLPARQMRRIRGARLAMIFQDPMMTLNPVLRIETQMMEAIRAHEPVSRAQARERARAGLADVGIPSPDARLRAYPHQLSGGMRQRVAIAIAMLGHPACIIADEPTTALDVTIQAQILDLMRKLRDELGTSIILITHDLGVIAEMVEEVIVMYAGKIVERTDVRSLFRDPKHPYTEGLLGSLPKLGEKADRLQTIEGVVPSPFNMPTGCRFHPRCQYARDICREEQPELLTLGEGHEAACFIHTDYKSMREKVG